MTTTTRTFLLTMWEGGGTIPPELGVARRLIQRGHSVHVLGDPTIEDSARAAGCGFSPWVTAPHRTSLDPSEDLFKDWEAPNPLVMLRNARDRFMAGPAADFARDTAAAIAQVRPDAVLADGMILGSCIAAEGAGLPVAALMPNIWMVPTKGVPAMGPGFAPSDTRMARLRDAAMRAVATRVFDGGLTALNAARGDHGLAPLTSFWDQVLSADRVLVLTSSAFDFAARHVPPNVVYTGPVLDDPTWTDPWSSPWDDEDDRPLVLVALSSTFQDQLPLLHRVVEGLSTMPIRAVVTLGQMLEPGSVTSTDNVVVVPSAPHSTLLAEAAAVVTHCGHGTTMKTLAAGVPMVCIPMGRDQNDTAARVTHQGAGVRLSPKASSRSIATALDRVLHDPAAGVSARRLAGEIHCEIESSPLIDELEALAQPQMHTA